MAKRITASAKSLPDVPVPSSATSSASRTTKSKGQKESKSKETKTAKGLNAQPEISIGLVGHVDHGKTTLTKALTGKWTDTHSEELKRGITIRLGYADASFYHYEKEDSYGITETSPSGEKGVFVRKVSFVDAPGHETLMATMLCGAAIMDGALLLISATEKCPQPQTREHLMGLEMSGIDKVIVVQNKIDAVDEEEAKEHYEQIKAFLKGTKYEHAPVIPISALYDGNINILIETIQEVIPTPQRDTTQDPVMFVARSFDINKPGIDPVKLQGGVLGGSLMQGIIHVGDEVEIRPGRIYEKANQLTTQALFATVESAMGGGASLDAVGPGGTVALRTSLDPSIVAADSLVGAIVGKAGKLPPVWSIIKLKVKLLDRVVGTKEELVVKPLAERESLMLNVNSATSLGIVTDLAKGIATLSLKLPVCAAQGSKITLSRRLDNRWRLVGFGIIQG